tara:strand:+ start:1348 stop:2145 length:798 start_codon:yes stop_codon:yes gene_type:complete
LEKLKLNMTNKEYGAAYKKDGFCCLPKEALPSEQVELAALSVSEVRDGHFDTGMPPSSHPVYDPNNLCKINDAHLASNALYNLLTKSQLGTQIAGVTNSSFVQVWATQLLIKPPGSRTKGHVGWHQDRQYWEYWQGENGLFTAWIALSEVDEKSGPMQFVVNSHTWGFLNKGDFFSSDQQALKKEIKGVVNQEWCEKVAVLPKGRVSLHHCLTIHGSLANESTKPRISLAVHLRNQHATPLPESNNYYVSNLGNSRYSPVIFGEL